MKDIHYKMLFACAELIIKVLKTEKTNSFKRVMSNSINVHINVEKHDTHYIYYISFDIYNGIKQSILSISMDSLPVCQLPVDKDAIIGTSLRFSDRNIDFDTQSPDNIGSYLQDDHTLIPIQEDIFEEWAFQQSLVYDFVPSKENYEDIKRMLEYLTSFGITFFCMATDIDSINDFFPAVLNCTQLYQREVLDDQNIQKS